MAAEFEGSRLHDDEHPGGEELLRSWRIRLELRRETME